MNKLFIIAIVVIIHVELKAEIIYNNYPIDTSKTSVTIHHKYYTTEFDTVLYLPIVVKFWLTKDMFNCSEPYERTDNFKPDPKLPDYTDLEDDYEGTGYDRGHNMDAKDNECDLDGMNESFYYSNMCPQTTQLNRGKWKRLEEYCRELSSEYDSILIWCGSTPGNKKIKRITIPQYCWKIVYIIYIDSIIAFLMPNKKKLTGKFNDYIVSLEELENFTNIQFVKP